MITNRKFFPLLHCKFCPFYMIILHNIICLFHTKPLIKRNGIFICYQIYCDVFLAACYSMRSFHKLPANSVSLIVSVNSQICYIKPIRIICQPK